MPRYFLEVAYKGTAYKGFQIQENANTIQAEIEKALGVLHRKTIQLTGSSRTDAGVHADQNFFHFNAEEVHPQLVYKLNAILPLDIAAKNIYQMPDKAHARFDALSRVYQYKIHRFKNPFKQGLSFFYPYKVDINLLQEALVFLKDQNDFSGFCKTNTQVKNFNCSILECSWLISEEDIMFHIEANRFLRGMVRLLTGTLLQVGRGKVTMDNFKEHFKTHNKAIYSVPAEGLYLKEVKFNDDYLKSSLP